jgi:pimeloyl-ACP methyl ester carboxylesterase
MTYFERDGVRLAYDSVGDAGLPPVVLLHGLSSARSTWSRLIPALAATHRVFALDHRGHGHSSHAPGTYVLENYSADVVAFLEEIVGSPSALVGHSLGGSVAAAVAGDRADLVRGAVLEDPPLYVADRSSDGPSGVAAFFPAMRQMLRDAHAREATVEEYEAMLQAAPALNGTGTMADVLGPAGARAHAEAWRGLDPEVFTPAIDGTALAGGRPTQPIECPVLVLRADPALRAAFSEDDERRFLATNPRATVTMIEGASHAIHDEMPERFAAEVGGFLARLR